MFFRREKPRQLSFNDYLGNLKSSGFTVESLGDGKARASRNGCAVVFRKDTADEPQTEDPGIIVGNQIALLTDAGYQKFFITEDGKRFPANAQHLKALHDFKEDLKEALGKPSFYNESLGTVFSRHLYDRVKDRDRGVPTRPWE